MVVEAETEIRVGSETTCDKQKSFSNKAKMGTLVVDVEVTTDYYILKLSRVEIKNSIIEALKVVPVNTGRSVESTNSETIMTNKAFKKDQFQVIWSRKLYRMKRYIDTKVDNDTFTMIFTARIVPWNKNLRIRDCP